MVIVPPAGLLLSAYGVPYVLPGDNLSFVDNWPFIGLFISVIFISGLTMAISTTNDCAGLEHPFALATTVMIPPEVPATTLILLVVDEPVQPFGSDQV